MLKIKQSEENFILYERGEFKKPIMIVDICELQELHSEISYNIELYEEWQKKQKLKSCLLYTDPIKSCQAIKDRADELNRKR